MGHNCAFLISKTTDANDNKKRFVLTTDSGCLFMNICWLSSCWCPNTYNRCPLYNFPQRSWVSQCVQVFCIIPTMSKIKCTLKWWQEESYLRLLLCINIKPHPNVILTGLNNIPELSTCPVYYHLTTIRLSLFFFFALKDLMVIFLQVTLVYVVVAGGVLLCGVSASLLYRNQSSSFLSYTTWLLTHVQVHTHTHRMRNIYQDAREHYLSLQSILTMKHLAADLSDQQWLPIIVAPVFGRTHTHTHMYHTHTHLPVLCEQTLTWGLFFHGISSGGVSKSVRQANQTLWLVMSSFPFDHHLQHMWHHHHHLHVWCYSACCHQAELYSGHNAWATQ